MPRTAVVAMRCADGHVPVIADAVRALVAAPWNVALLAPGSVAGALTLALGPSPSGRRAIPAMVHTLVDPADPALTHPADTVPPEPLAILEAEAIAALVRSGFPVVIAGHVPVVPLGDTYRPVAATLDAGAVAQRLAGDLGASALVFVARDDDGPLLHDSPPAGEIDVLEAERRLEGEARLASELRAAVRFLRAGGELAVITTLALLDKGLDGPADGARLLHIRRRVSRPRSDAPVLAAGWC